MRGAAEFCLAWLIDDGKDHLTTCPSESTENNFMAPDGKTVMTSAGCTMDMTLIRELFANCVHASEVLKTDLEFAGKLAAASKRLIPFQIGRYGQLQEWSVDFEEATPGQRHMSHVYGLYPGNRSRPRQRLILRRQRVFRSKGGWLTAARIQVGVARGRSTSGRAWEMETRPGIRSPC
jgi:alpha-L-fucosidase 2